jgi:hypothetical protein
VTAVGMLIGNGLVVQPTFGHDGEVYYAEVEPAGSRWLPWPGRTSRWWYEVHELEKDGERATWAYVEGGSGGGFTLAACVRRAQEAVSRFAEGAHA